MQRLVRTAGGANSGCGGEAFATVGAAHGAHANVPFEDGMKRKARLVRFGHAYLVYGENGDLPESTRTMSE